MSPEPRRDLPVPLRVGVRRPDGAEREEYAVNVSPGGLCLHLRDVLRPGDEIGVVFSLPPDDLRVDARARVVWTSAHDGPGDAPRFWETGVQLLDLDEPVREALHRYASEPAGRRR